MSATENATKPLKAAALQVLDRNRGRNQRATEAKNGRNSERSEGPEKLRSPLDASGLPVGPCRDCGGRYYWSDGHGWVCARCEPACHRPRAILSVSRPGWRVLGCSER